MSKLTREFYNRDTLDVTRDLLGKYLVRLWDGAPLVCRITETEGYVGRIDKACHAYGWGTRTRPASALKDSYPGALSSSPGVSLAASPAFWDVNLSQPEVLRNLDGAAAPKPGWVRVPQPSGYKRTKRTETLFAPPGTAYVYLIYGMYDCLNFVTEPAGEPCAVLIRALEARYNADLIAHNRYGCSMAAMNAYQRKNFLNGPGKLCRGLALTRAQNGLDLTGDELYVVESLPDLGLPPCPADGAALDIQVGRRVGIDYAEEAADFPWRCWI